MPVLKLLHKFLLRIHFTALKRPRAVLLALGVLLIMSAVAANRLQFLVMIGDLLDSKFETYSQFQELNHSYTEENNVSLVLHPRTAEGNITFGQHCEIINWMNYAAERNPNILRVASAYGVRDLHFEGSRLKSDPVLIKSCSAQENSSPENQAQLAEQLRSLRQHPSGTYLTSSDARDVMLIFYFKNLKESSRFGSFDVSGVNSLRNSLQEHFLNKNVDLEAVWTGAGTYQFFLQKGYLQMLWVNLLTSLVALFAFRVIFGTWKSGVLFLSTLSITMVLVYGFMGAMKFPVDSISCAVPIMVLIATLEDIIYILYIHSKGFSLKTSLRRMLFPSFFTSLSTIIGFLALGFVDLQIVARFGLVCAVGALVEWLILFVGLPAMPNLLNLIWVKQSGKTATYRLGIMSKLSIFSFGKKTAVSCLLVFAIVVLFFNRMTLSDSPDEIFPPAHPVRMASEYMLKSRGWKSEISLLFPGRTPANEVRTIVEEIKLRHTFITNYELPDDVINYALKTATDDQRELVSSYWRDSDMSARWFSDRNSTKRAFLFSSSSDVMDIAQLRAAIKEICSNKCYPANILISYSEFGLKTLKALLESFFGCLIFVVLLLLALAYCFKIDKKWILLISALWGPFALLACFLVFQIKIFFATSVVMAVLVGLAGDNTIQFMYATRRRSLRNGVDSLAGATVICTFMMVLTSLCLLLSDFLGVRKIGIMMSVGFLLILIGDLYVLRGLSELTGPKASSDL